MFSALGYNSYADSVVAHTIQTTKLLVAGANIQGRRINNEDADDYLLLDKYSFFAIYDGHNGDSCSNFLKQKLLLELSKLEKLDEASIRSLYDKIDFEYRVVSPSAGSTAVIAVIDNEYNKVMFINLGDSRGMLVRNGKPIFETVDHTPKSESEKLRIAKAGYYVHDGRILGCLAVSRCFGDFSYKGNPHQHQNYGVSIDPDISSWINLEPDDLIVLNCDGLNEANHDNNDIAGHLPNNSKNTQELLTLVFNVINRSLRDSNDNISLLVIKINTSERSPERQKIYIPGNTKNLKYESLRRDSFKSTAAKNNIELLQALEERKKNLQKFFDGTLSMPCHQFLLACSRHSEDAEPDLDSLTTELRKLSDPIWLKSLLDKFQESNDTNEDNEPFKLALPIRFRGFTKPKTNENPILSTSSKLFGKKFSIFDLKPATKQ